jgi:ribosome biogenesis ATPase
VDLDALGTSPALTGFSGADLAALVREACVVALKESIANGGGGAMGGGPAGQGGAPPPLVHACHFEAACRLVQPSVSRKDQQAYNALRTRLRSSRGHLRPDADAAPPGEAGGGAAVDGGMLAEGVAGAASMAGMVSADNGGGGEGGAPMEEDPVAQP